MVTPTTQKAGTRPISFLLQNTLNPALNETMRLVIRPEDLRRTEPSLQTPVAALEGAWLDDWGPGLSQIIIAGHTGWRGNKVEDGGELFQDLRDVVWSEWRRQRTDLVKQGQSPDLVKLIYIDTLNEITAQVAPGAFALSRSRSRPLLYQYSITMTVLADNLDIPQQDVLGLNPDGSSKSPDAVGQGLTSLGNMVKTLTGAAAAVSSIVRAADGSIAGLIGTVASTISAVTALPADAAGFVGAALLAGRICAGSRNIILSYAQASNLAGLDVLPFAQTASALATAMCVFNNVLGIFGPFTYTDYSSLDGTSSCATTLGVGQQSPFLGQNPFDTFAETPHLPIQLSAPGQNALSAALAIDPVLGAPASSELVGLAGALSNGGIIL